MEQQPILLSIKCLAYNHEKYIRDTLEGFIMQKTNFRFEVIVHDDASTDGTAAIIKEYADKYPDIIKPIFETENQYSKHDGSLRKIMNSAMYPDAKYIAYCEGDDYWTDPYKLQKQVDFLESHPKHSLCIHEFQRLREDTGQISYNKTRFLEENPTGLSFDLDFYCIHEWFTMPLSLVYRRKNLDQNNLSKCYRSKDVTLFYLLLMNGKGFLMPDIMGTYRIHSGGIHSGSQFASFFKDSLQWNILELIKIDPTYRPRLFFYHTLKRELHNLIKSRDRSLIKYTVKNACKYIGFWKTLMLFIRYYAYPLKCLFLKLNKPNKTRL